MSTQLPASHLTAWRGFLTAHARIIAQIDRDLHAAGCIPLDWYDVLIELVEAPEGRLRMHDLANRVVLSRSTLTHLTDRLNREGYLVRERAADDRRGVYAVLTEKGRAAVRQAWPIYAQGIAASFANHLSPQEVEMLTQIFSRLIAEPASSR